MRISDWSSDVCSSDLSYQLSDPITFATHVSREYDDIAKSILVRWGIDLLHVRHMAWHSLNLIDLAGGIGIPVVCSFHDYYSICPTVNLIDDQGRYHPHGVTEHRSEEHTSELQSLMRISYAVFCLKNKKKLQLLTEHH